MKVNGNHSIEPTEICANFSEREGCLGTLPNRRFTATQHAEPKPVFCSAEFLEEYLTREFAHVTCINKDLV